MFLTRNRAYARAGLVGNPSDGYHGKTISISVRNFCAEVVLYEWDSVDIVLAEDDRATFGSVYDLARDVRLHGYYGGIRLIKATIKQFVEYCQSRKLTLHERNFSVRYETNIPRQVGLAGSSAIIVAILRSLMDFYGIRIPIEAQPSFRRGRSTRSRSRGAAARAPSLRVRAGRSWARTETNRCSTTSAHTCRCPAPGRSSPSSPDATSSVAGR